MVGLNLLVVGATAEAYLGDTPAPTVPPSEGIDFAGVLATILPADESPTPDEAATPDAPDADLPLTPLTTLGLTTLPIPPVLEPMAAADHTAQLSEPSLRPAREARTLPPELPPPQKPVAAGADTPEPMTVLGDGMGESDLMNAHPAALESLLAVEGEASPVPARQAAPPSPPNLAATQAAPTLEDSLQGARTDAAPSAPATPPVAPNPLQVAPPTPFVESPVADDAPPVLPRESRQLNDASPTLPHDTRPIHAQTPIPTPSDAATATADATPLEPAQPNWSAAERIAHHIERAVYERERNRLTVRLDPPELGVVELRVQATGNEVQAWLTAERDLTRQMLQQAQQYLREQLESRGLQLTHFDVGAQSQFRYAPREQHQPSAAYNAHTRTPTATDSLLYDGRWSVWV